MDRQTAAAVALALALLGVCALLARREVAANQRAYDAFVSTGTAPPAPPAVSGATLNTQERL
ncbi:hypothetical protein LBMAG42_44490 [Deltaproteobacteria bacterium]|nr:hypothetical protein LBMAG42_44490 [Deltaproteobacteria bacterium]